MGIYPVIMDKYNPAQIRQNLQLKRQLPEGKIMLYQIFIRFLRKLMIATAMTISVTACAGNPATANCPDNNRVNQVFSFGEYGENPDIEILDVYYGIPNCPAIYKTILFNGKPMQGVSMGGSHRRAWELKVKWRVKSIGQEYEEAVDLRNRLPNDMTNHRLHFSIEGHQLIIYLITPERRPPEMLPIGPKATQYRKTLIVFPDSSK